MSQYPPPPPPPYGTHTNVVVAQPGYVAMPMIFREVPVRCRCSACGADILTSTSFETGVLTWVICLVVALMVKVVSLAGSTSFETGVLTWVICLVVALMGLWLGCCLIPFCINGCKDVVHTCPNCRNVVGKYNRM